MGKKQGSNPEICTGIDSIISSTGSNEQKAQKILRQCLDIPLNSLDSIYPALINRIDRIKNIEEHNLYRSAVYYSIFLSNQYAGQYDASYPFIDSATVYADKVIDKSKIIGKIYANYCMVQTITGDMVKGYKYGSEAIDILKDIEGEDITITRTLVFMSDYYIQRNDCEGVLQMAKKAESILSNRANMFIRHTIARLYGSYYHCEYSKDTSNLALRDSMIYYFRLSLAHIEKLTIEELTLYRASLPENYINMAIMFETYYDPPLIDSAEIY